MIKYDKTKNTILIIDWASFTMQAKSGMVSEISKRRMQDDLGMFPMYRKSALGGIDVDLKHPDSTKKGLLNVFFYRLVDHIEQFAPSKLVFAMEGKHCWRFDAYDGYKSTRTHESWDLVFTYSEFKRFRDECAFKLAGVFGAHYMRDDRCEGDDILAIVSRSARHEYDNVIVSTGDRDMLQLTRHENIFVFDSKDQEFKFTPNNDVRYFLDLKAVGGDRGDSIGGIVLPGKTKAVAKAKFVEKAEGDLHTYCESLGVLDQYIRNRELVDFDYIPSDIFDDVKERLYVDKYVVGNYFDRYSLGLSDINQRRLEDISQKLKLNSKDTVLDANRRIENL